MRGIQKILRICQYGPARSLRVDEVLETAEYVCDGRLKLLVGGLKFGQFARGLAILGRTHAQCVAARHQTLQNVAEGIGVLAHEERDFGVDNLGGEHVVRIFCQSLCQHDQLAGQRDFALRRAQLQLERRNLLRDVEQCRITRVDAAHRRTQGNQVFLLCLNQREVLVGLLPFLRQRLEHGLNLI